MMQNRTHTCGELRLSDAGKQVKIVGWMENVRVVSASLAFIVVRDFYGTTQVVAETEDMEHLQGHHQGVHHLRGGHCPGARLQEQQDPHRRH